MGAIGELIFWILKAVLPWLFSGSVTQTVTNTEGLKDMDVTGTKDLTLKNLPDLALLVGTCIVLGLGLGGCFALGGAQVQVIHKMVEPGDTVEVVDGKVDVRVPGSNEVGPLDPAGKVLMPKSVYRSLRAEWVKNHPSDPIPDTKPAEKPK